LISEYIFSDSALDFANSSGDFSLPTCPKGSI
jgi:hypothetical protein